MPTTDLIGVQKHLTKTLTGGSLANLVKQQQKQKQTMLLIDCSGSMGEPLGSPVPTALHGFQDQHATKHRRLQQIVADLHEQGINPLMVKFGGYGQAVQFCSEIPNPSGGTPLAEAIDFASSAGGQHLIVISDGLPDDPIAALQAAQMAQVTIDVFYVGPRPSEGERFLQQLASQSGGQCQSVSLSQPKELLAGLKGLLTC